MTDHDRRALKILARYGEIRPGAMGEELSSSTRTTSLPQHFARPGGKVLRRLVALGYAELTLDGWAITSLGKMEANGPRDPL